MNYTVTHANLSHRFLYLLVTIAFASGFFAPVAMADEQPLAPGDRVTISISGVPLEDTQMLAAGSPYTLGDDGRIALAYIGTLKASGTKPSDLARAIERAYVSGEIYTRPSIQVTIDAQGTLRMIYVSGEVKQPQGVEYRNGMTVFNAITACGGPTDFADMKDVRLIRSLPDGRVQTIPCNLKYLSRGTGVDPTVLPNDRIIVPN